MRHSPRRWKRFLFSLLLLIALLAIATFVLQTLESFHVIDSAQAIDLFIANLQQIIDLCAAQRVKVLLATVPINLRPTLPVISPHLLEQGVSDAEFRAGEELFAAGDYRAAIDHYDASEAMVPATYRLAECHERLGDFAQAEYFYRFNHRLHQGIRAGFEANERIRQLAAAHDYVYLVDLEKAARDASPHGLPGLNLYVDICHMRHEGYYLMAQDVARAGARRADSHVLRRAGAQTHDGGNHRA